LSLFRLVRRALLFLSILLGVAVAGLWFISQKSPSTLEPLVERGASYFLGRELLIDELIAVTLAEDTAIELRGLKLANAPWAAPGPMLSVGYARVVINLPSIFDEHSILLRDTEVHQLQLELLAPEGREPNWDLPLKIGDSEPADDPEELLLPLVFEQLQLKQLGVDYRGVDQDLDIRVEQLQLGRDAATGLSDITLAGRVNELALSGGGLIGPTKALQTGKELELDVALALGEMEIKAQGAVADALALSGADLVLDIRAPRSRRVLDLLGLHEVRDGPLVFEGRLADASPGLRVEAEGELADFGLGARGVIESPMQLDGIELSFYVDGPSMLEAGLIFGVAGFNDIPYDLSGEIYRRGSVLKVENGRFRAAQGRVNISGVLPSFPEIDDWQVDVQASELDLTVLGPITGIEGLPQLYCDVDGRLYSDQQGVELVDLKIDDGDVVLLVNGVVGEQPEFVGTSLHAKFSGSDLTRLQSLIGLETLPTAPYELEGALLRNPAGWRIEDVHLASRGIQINASAEMDRLADFERLEGRLSLSSPDLALALRDYGIDVETLAPVPLEVSGDARLVGDSFEITGMAGTFGEVVFTGDAWLSATEGFAGSRLRLDARADNMGTALASFTDAGLPGQPFSLSVDTTYHAPLVEVDRLQGHVGANQVSGQLQLEDKGQLASGQLMLQGPSIRKLLDMAGVDLEVTDGAYRASSAIEMSPRHLALTGLKADVADSDLSGDLKLSFGDVPRLDMDFHSRVLQLSAWFPRLDGQDAVDPEPENEDNLKTPPTKREMTERLIPDTPLPLDWIKQMDGRWRYRVERAEARENAYSTMLLDLDLNAGVLSARNIGWEGTVSSGWADLEVDARQAPYDIDLDFTSTRVPLLWLIAGGDVPKQDSNYRGSLTASGGTLREAVASLDGELILRASGAQLNNRGLDLILGDVFETVVDRLNPFSTTSEYTEVECVAGALRFRDGVVAIDPGLVMRTDKIDIVSGGGLDLNTEALNITFNTRSRRGIGISPGKAITPYLKVAGNLANPWLTVDPEAMAVSGTAAIATVGLSILAESMYDRWVATSNNPCQEVFKQIRKDEEYKQLLALPKPGLTDQAVE
jgi:AsmA-like C-terminal region